MGKAQKKTGKGRLDKYYKLAKEQGYRARSAYKLIQLNKKFGFLENARCTIDLCAAPGGWLQVASKYMPMNSIIVGVDLVPIKPIPRVTTFAADITTPNCRNLIRGELKDWKADVVLHDGAPNVGTAWIQDAYTQSELVLMSLKLAVEFLIKGGTFVTKVFRSVDYNNLVWVFNQLFGKVEATKPPSSRNVSAEIFVVCRDFLAPKHLDPKFLDPKHVFKDLSTTIADSEKGTSANNVHANVFQPEKKRRKREGYADGDYTLFKETPASEFVKGSDPIVLLGSCNKISFTTEEEKGWLKLACTTEDVKANCDDLKVLGKGDFKTLIRWRLALREEIGLDVKARDTEDATEAVTITEELDDEDQISEELERLNAEAASRAKRARRRANELRTKTIQRMQLQMTAPLDIGLEQSDAALGFGQEDMFDIDESDKSTWRKETHHMAHPLDGSDLEESGEDTVEGVISDNEDSDREGEGRAKQLEAELDGLYDTYQQRLRERDAKHKAREARKNAEKEDWGGISGMNETDSDVNDNDSEGGWENVRVAKDEFDDSSDDSTDENDEAQIPKKRPGSETGRLSKKPRPEISRNAVPPAPSKAATLWFSQILFQGIHGVHDDVTDENEDEEHSTWDEIKGTSKGGVNTVGQKQVCISMLLALKRTLLEWNEIKGDISRDDEVEFIPQDVSGDEDMWDADDDNQDEIKSKVVEKFGLLTAEAVTLAQKLVNRETTKTQLINDGFNRYSLNSKDDLPAWFLDDEAKHYKPNIPVTKEAIAALRAKQRALDARPIKKVAEAKARKKYKAAQRLEKAMKKAEGVISTTDLTEKEKAQQIEKLMYKGRSKGKMKKEVKVVVAKGAHKGVKGRPKGVKGRYVMVDARMKKEVRAKNRKAKEAKGRRR
ncbi:hypothetical protein AX16_009675 [Volvariella volvacea WC 439]|nr:hypothetical protein AX16_009675 [Volvariella volvacea WC 439]